MLCCKEPKEICKSILNKKIYEQINFYNMNFLIERYEGYLYNNGFLDAKKSKCLNYKNNYINPLYSEEFINEEKLKKLYLQIIKENYIVFDCYYFISGLIYEYFMKKNIFEFNFKITDNIRYFIMLELYDLFGDPNEDDNEIINSVYQNEQRVLKYKNIKTNNSRGSTNIRKSAKKLREEMLNIYGSCRICGIKNKEFLVVSHIKDYAKSTQFEQMDINNCFLLCSKHDFLFDKKLITFNDNGNIKISKRIKNNDLIMREYLITGNEHINLNKHNKRYLKWHREYFDKED
ncbi:HNH endonuclease [Clostridium botulinum]|uniref:HNH endonuclease n=1 Tax=Clostridium botulinum TaxID=1491 RepID=UPI00046EB83A|nr:HNH endonuclease [Clostridium botulinum]AUN22537.1 HNH endonuclease [Clostridium botulinum]MBN3411220.1 HNH endonuclease [Clostridium botulinum]MBN3418590.1 HNH endonuclease [Clostridium botulinum]MBN3426100.1 HNH endonuclease [Clostridium botulinum]QDY18263.1 HNH endonuclease [Clostridium botulinum]